MISVAEQKLNIDGCITVSFKFSIDKFVNKKLDDFNCS